MLVYGNRGNRLLKYFHSSFDVIVVPRPHVLYDNWGEDWLSWNLCLDTIYGKFRNYMQGPSRYG